MKNFDFILNQFQRKLQNKLSKELKNKIKIIYFNKLIN